MPYIFFLFRSFFWLSRAWLGGEKRECAQKEAKEAKGKMRALDLFSGVGGLALALLPFVEHVGYCEIDAYCRRVLAARMREHALPRLHAAAESRT